MVSHFEIMQTQVDSSEITSGEPSQSMGAMEAMASVVMDALMHSGDSEVFNEFSLPMQNSLAQYYGPDIAGSALYGVGPHFPPLPGHRLLGGADGLATIQLNTQQPAVRYHGAGPHFPPHPGDSSRVGVEAVAPTQLHRQLPPEIPWHPSSPDATLSGLAENVGTAISRERTATEDMKISGAISQGKKRVRTSLGEPRSVSSPTTHCESLMPEHPAFQREASQKPKSERVETPSDKVAASVDIDKLDPVSVSQIHTDRCTDGEKAFLVWIEGYRCARCKKLDIQECVARGGGPSCVQCNLKKTTCDMDKKGRSKHPVGKIGEWLAVQNVDQSEANFHRTQFSTSIKSWRESSCRRVRRGLGWCTSAHAPP